MQLRDNQILITHFHCSLFFAIDSRNVGYTGRMCRNRSGLIIVTIHGLPESVVNSYPLVLLCRQKMKILNLEMQHVGRERNLANVFVNGFEMHVALLVDPGVLINVVLTGPSRLGNFIEFLNDQLLVNQFRPVEIGYVAISVV